MLCFAIQFSRCNDGGDKEDRTPDLLRARQALSQLSYVPMLIAPKSILRFSGDNGGP